MAQSINNLPIGAKISCAWNGGYLLFKIVDKDHIGYPTNNVTLLCCTVPARSIFAISGYNQSYNANYASSTIRAYVIGEGFNGFEDKLKANMLATTIPFAHDYGYTAYVTDKLFIPSLSELFNYTGGISGLGIDGTKFSGMGLPTDTVNGPTIGTSGSDYWIRSTSNSGSTDEKTRGRYISYAPDHNGRVEVYELPGFEHGVRFVFNVANTLKVTDSVTSRGGYEFVWNTAPTTPSTITIPATIKGGESIAVSWGASSDAESNLAGYRLERSVDGAVYAQVYQGTPLSSAQAITKGWNSVAFRVKAYDVEGLESAYATTPTRTVINNTAPTVPSSITVPATVKGGESITVSWGASTDADGNLAGYRLERSTNGGAWTQVYQGTATSSSQAITAGWKTVAFQVKAYDAEGAESGYRTSETRSVNTAPTVPGTITVPTPLRANTDVTVSWTASTDVDSNLSGYRLERSVDGGGYTQVYQGTGLSSSQQIAAGWSTVSFRVKAYDAVGDESDYRTGSVITINRPPTLPGAITCEPVPKIGRVVTLTCGASTDPDGNTMQYVWERSVDGGSYEEIGKAPQPSITDTIPMHGLAYRVRVKALDSVGDESAYSTSMEMEILYNEPPATPGAIAYASAPREGTNVTMTCGASTDPDGDGVRYVWERKSDTEEYQQIGVTDQPSITDTVPEGCTFYQVRVKAADTAGKYSNYSVGAILEVLRNTPPAISGEDVNLENQTDAVQYSYTIEDPDDSETLTVTEKVIYGGEEWILRVFQAEPGETYTADTSSVWLELIGGAQLVIEVRDFLNASAVRTVFFTRVVGRIAASRCFSTGQALEKCLIAFDPRELPEGCQLTLEASNNPFDQEPVWEDITGKANTAIHSFSNTAVSTPGLGYRFIVTRGAEAARINRVIVKYA